MKEFIAKWLFVKWLKPFITIEKHKDSIKAERQIRILLFDVIVATATFSTSELIKQ